MCIRDSIGIDVGIYYATALLSILGPAKKVCGMSQTYQPERTHFFTSRGHFGESYTITAETLLAATVQFASGAVGSFHFNSASIRCEKPQLILYGTQGIVYLPDPNFFGGEVRVLAKGQTEPYVFPHTHAYDGDDRGIGVAEMALSLIHISSPVQALRLLFSATMRMKSFGRTRMRWLTPKRCRALPRS